MRLQVWFSKLGKMYLARLHLITHPPLHLPINNVSAENIEPHHLVLPEFCQVVSLRRTQTTLGHTYCIVWVEKKKKNISRLKSQQTIVETICLIWMKVASLIRSHSNHSTETAMIPCVYHTCCGTQWGISHPVYFSN